MRRRDATLSGREREVLTAVALGLDPVGSEGVVERLVVLGFLRREVRVVMTEAGRVALDLREVGEKG